MATTTTTTTKRLYFRILEREKKTAKRWKSLLLLFLLAWSGYCLPLAGTRNAVAVAVAVVGPLKSWSSPKPTENGVTQSFYFVLSFYYFYVFSFVSGWREHFGVGKHSFWSHMVFFIYVFFSSSVISTNWLWLSVGEVVVIVAAIAAACDQAGPDEWFCACPWTWFRNETTRITLKVLGN